jgi:O-antigen/teichoic acid export membrane protein
VNKEQDNEAVKDSGYDGILKYTGIFGGVQGLVSLITMVKVVIVSKLLGPIGVGLVDVYNRSIELVKKSTDLGISYSAVQSISEHRDESSSSSNSMPCLRKDSRQPS